MKRLLSLHLLLIIGWVALTGDSSPGNIFLAVVAASIGLWLSRRVLEANEYLHRIPLFFAFIGRLLYDLLMSSLIVVHDVFTLRNHYKPRILKVPVAGRSDLELAFFANCITLTPGTTALDVTEDRQYMIIHAMYAEDAEAIRRQMSDDLERRLLRVMRGDVPQDPSQEETVPC
ncbi:MAG: Na+/H+ antiporter subunit E [Planctomycetota bacterium]|nr:MAG: Na+/H+ antiporter subunit E [Planctomycetota bacterium]